MQKNRNITNYRIRGYTYVRKKILAPLVLQPAPSLVHTSSLHSCYSQPLLSYIPPRAIADTCKRCLHTGTAMRQRPFGEWSFRVAVFVWAHTQCVPAAQPIKANY